MNLNPPEIPSLADSLMNQNCPNWVSKEIKSNREQVQKSLDRNKNKPCSRCHSAPRHITKFGKAKSMCKECDKTYWKNHERKS